MIWDQRPSIALSLSLLQDNGQALKEGFAVLVVFENLSSFDSPGHDVLQKAGGIKSGLAGHGFFC